MGMECSSDDRGLGFDRVSLKFDDIRKIQQSDDGLYLFIGTKDVLYLVRDEGGRLWKELDSLMSIRAWCSHKHGGECKTRRYLYLNGDIRYKDEPYINYYKDTEPSENVKFCFYEPRLAHENSERDDEYWERLYGQLDAHLS